jgi:hypothetical protein
MLTTTLGHTLQVYIPNESITEEVRDEAGKLTVQAGGATRYEVAGGWYDKSNRLISEQVQIQVWHHTGDLLVLPLVQAMFDGGEDSVLVVDDGIAYTYSNEEPEDNGL